MKQIIEHALRMLRDDPDLLADARVGAPLGNSILGGVIQITLETPRQYAEAAIVEAVRRIDAHPPRHAYGHDPDDGF